MPGHHPTQSKLAAFAAAVLIGISILAYQNIGIAGAGLVIAGGLAGISLFQASFGFTASWKALVVDGRTHGLRVQLLMFGVVGAIALPMIAFGDGAFRGSLAPVSLAVVLGAALFGIGMQISGACASGAMFTAGSGSIRSVFTIIGFITGVTAAVATFESWSVWPSMETVSLTHSFGGYGAVAVHIAVTAAALGLAALYERYRRGHVEGLLVDQNAGSSLPTRLLGRWPMLYGAVGLGVAALLILALSGRPWALISAYALWGSKLVALTGEDVSFWGHWAANPAILDRSIFSDAASVVDLAAITGATLAASLTGRFVWRGGLPLRSVAIALIGGIVMGFGARLSVGCNIGAFFSGIISGSLHGWVWGIFALTGTALAIGVRSLAARLFATTGSLAAAGAKAPAAVTTASTPTAAA
jgi:uncharacterized protein